MINVHIDIETYSPADLKKVGVYKYAEHEETEILCIAWAFDDGPVQLWTGVNYPYELEKAFYQNRGYILCAHNANFERVMFNSHYGRRLGFPPTNPEQWRCTAAKARKHNLPGALGDCAKELGLTEKDETGKRVMMKLSRPRKPTKKDSSRRWTLDNAEADFEILYDYCVNDVVVEREIDIALNDLSESEQDMYVLDQEINDRGLFVDEYTVALIMYLNSSYMSKLREECRQICGYNPTQRDKLLEWLNFGETIISGLTKDEVQKVLDRDDLGDDEERVLEIRQLTAQTSTKKYDVLARAAGKDNRLRGTLLFNGAAQTGRWAGRLFQPQNIARGTIKDTEQAVEFVHEKDNELLSMLYGDPVTVFSSCIRSMITAPEGYHLLVSDYSSIEARVVQWLAGDQDALDIFRKGLDTYIDMAAHIFDLEYDDVTKDDRFVGKVAILGLGYAMGAKKFKETCASYGKNIRKDLAEHTVQTYRKKHNKLTAFWNKTERAAKAAIKEPGQVHKAGVLSFQSDKQFLRMRLPSGRCLHYYKAHLSHEPREWGTSEVIKYRGLMPQSKKPGWLTTYSGKLVENATQAVARDLLAHALKVINADGMKIVLHVHDEVVVEAQDNCETIERLDELMEQAPKWAAGLPIKAEGFACNRYKK